MELKASNVVRDLDMLVGGCARDRRLQAFRIYLDKLSNQYVAIVRSLTSVLALGELRCLKLLHLMDLNGIDYPVVIHLSGHSTSNMHKIWTYYLGQVHMDRESFNDNFLSYSLGLNINPCFVCQKVENHTVGAPCGVMGQIT
ncbi:hypothetical protein SO802_006638 [Lithocarpus litseifolius]|uniref:Uncharacterized protein n=1 Tax=Lithocarpus litseifolius TaxID=425828 RepID=A0AAW2DQP8_9ROSI